MRFERLDERISVLRWAPTQSRSGEVQDAWTVVLDREPASRREVSGDERVAFAGPLASQMVDFYIRYSTAAAAITPKDRIVFPALAEDAVPDVIYDPQQYDIVSIVEIDRRRMLKFTAKRRPDLAPLSFEPTPEPEVGGPVGVWGLIFPPMQEVA